MKKKQDSKTKTFIKVNNLCKRYFFEVSEIEALKFQKEWETLQELILKIKKFPTKLSPLFLPVFIVNHPLRDDTLKKNDSLKQCFQNAIAFEKNYVLIKNHKTN